MNSYTVLLGLVSLFFLAAICFVLAILLLDDDDRPGPQRYNPFDSWS